MPLTTIARLTWSQEGFVRNVVFRNVSQRVWRKSGYCQTVREQWRENQGLIKSTSTIISNTLWYVFFALSEIPWIPVSQHPMETRGNPASESTLICQVGIKMKRRRQFTISMRILKRWQRANQRRVITMRQTKIFLTISNMIISGEVKLFEFF